MGTKLKPVESPSICSKFLRTPTDGYEIRKKTRQLGWMKPFPIYPINTGSQGGTKTNKQTVKRLCFQTNSPATRRTHHCTPVLHWQGGRLQGLVAAAKNQPQRGLARLKELLNKKVDMIDLLNLELIIATGRPVSPERRYMKNPSGPRQYSLCPQQNKGFW